MTPKRAERIRSENQLEMLDKSMRIKGNPVPKHSVFTQDQEKNSTPTFRRLSIQKLLIKY